MKHWWKLDDCHRTGKKAGKLGKIWKYQTRDSQLDHVWHFFYEDCIRVQTLHHYVSSH